jgi:HEAT repeat protein
MSVSRLRKFCHAASAALLASIVSAPALGAPLVYYSVQEVQLGTVSTKALVAEVVEAPASSASERVQAVFRQLQALNPGVYGKIELSVGSDFDVTGQVVVKVADLGPEELDVALGELYYSLRVHGARDIRVPSIGDSSLDSTRIAFPAFGPIVPAWEALPPRRYDGALIAVGADRILPSAVFYDLLKKRDGELAKQIATTFQGSNGAGKVRLLQGLSELELGELTGLLLPLLSDSSAQVRLAAVRALDDYRAEPRVISALEKTVQEDPSPEVKSAAVRVLVAAGNRKYEVFGYMEKLKDPNDGTVFEAVSKLVESKNPAVASALVDVLNHNSVEIREAALKGLMALQNGDAMESALASDRVTADMKVAVAKAMTGLDDQRFVTAGLAHLVIAGSRQDAAAAADALGKLKATGGVKALIAGLSNQSADVQLASANALGEIGSIDAVEPLAQLGSNSNPQVRDAATQAAVRILSAQPQSAVIEKTRSEDTAVRRIALMGLAQFGEGGRNRAVVQVLRERLKDPEAEIRRASAYALARIQDESIATELLAYKNDADAEIRAQVAAAMGWSRSGSAVETLIELLGDADSAVKLEAARGLAKKGDHSALEPLLQYVTYGRPEVRRAVMEAVVALAQPEDTERLLDIYLARLYDQDKEVKLTAIAGISKIRDPRVITGLDALVIDPDVEVQKRALGALGSLADPNATESIARALLSQDRGVRLAAIEAIATSGQQNAMKPLQEFMRNESDQELVRRAGEVYDNL